MGRVDGRVAFITGAARGQGRAHAIRLAEEGADIVAVDICAPIDGLPYPLATPDDLEQTARAVRERGRRVVARTADVRDIDQLCAAVSDAVDAFEHLDIVVANAGITGVYRAAVEVATRVRAFEQIVDVNLTGVYRTVEACKDALLAGGAGGSVIVISSLAGLRTLGAGGGYTEAKHGLTGLVKGYAHEFAPHRIRVNSINPTNVATPMILNPATFAAFHPELENPAEQDARESLAFLNLLPVDCLEPEDISDAVLFLASEESKCITGVTLPVDAGASIK